MICCFDSRHVVGYGIEEEDRKHTWMEDSEAVSFSALYLCQPYIYILFFCLFCLSILAGSSEIAYSILRIPKDFSAQCGTCLYCDKTGCVVCI